MGSAYFRLITRSTEVIRERDGNSDSESARERERLREMGKEGKCAKGYLVIYVNSACLVDESRIIAKAISQ